MLPALGEETAEEGIIFVGRRRDGVGRGHFCCVGGCGGVGWRMRKVSLKDFVKWQWCRRKDTTPRNKEIYMARRDSFSIFDLHLI